MCYEFGKNYHFALEIEEETYYYFSRFDREYQAIYEIYTKNKI